MSKFSILGHPLHPMLVALPIGLVFGAVAADVAYIATDRNLTWYDAATWASGAVAITGLAAAVPGLGDYLTMSMGNRSRLVATLHMIANAGLIALFGASFLLMLGDNATGGTTLVSVLVMHAVGIGLLTVSGWLGGELVYKHGLAVVGHSDTETEREREQPRRGVTAGQTTAGD